MWESPAFLNAGKTSFVWAEFNATRENYSFLVTRERLSVTKLTKDIVLDPDDPHTPRSTGMRSIFREQTR